MLIFLVPWSSSSSWMSNLVSASDHTALLGLSVPSVSSACSLIFSLANLFRSISFSFPAILFAFLMLGCLNLSCCDRPVFFEKVLSHSSDWNVGIVTYLFLNEVGLFVFLCCKVVKWIEDLDGVVYSSLFRVLCPCNDLLLTVILSAEYAWCTGACVYLA